MSVIQQNKTLVSNISQQCFELMPAERAISSIFLLINFVAGFPANLWVIWLICNGTTEQLASDIHQLTLAISELTYCLFLPVELSCLYTSEAAKWIICPPQPLYILWALQSDLVWVGRPLFQCCICVERYIAVVHPLIFMRWTFKLILESPPCGKRYWASLCCVSVSRLKPLKYKVTQCILSWCFYLAVVLLKFEVSMYDYLLIWFIPTLCIFLYCYFSALISLRRPRPGDREQERKTSGSKPKIKAIKIILVNLICFLVNYLPGLLAYYLSQRIYIAGLVSTVLKNFGIVCGLVNPLLYLHRARKLSCLKRALHTKIKK